MIWRWGASRRRRQRIPRGAPLGAAPAGEARQKPWLGVDCGEKEKRESGVRHGRVSVPLSCGGVKGLRWRVKEVIGKRFCGCRVGSGARAKGGRIPLWQNPDPDVGTDSQRGEAYLLPRSRLLRGRALRTTCREGLCRLRDGVFGRRRGTPRRPESRPGTQSPSERQVDVAPLRVGQDAAEARGTGGDREEAHLRRGDCDVSSLAAKVTTPFDAADAGVVGCASASAREVQPRAPGPLKPLEASDQLFRRPDAPAAATAERCQLGCVEALGCFWSCGPEGTSLRGFRAE